MQGELYMPTSWRALQAAFGANVLFLSPSQLQKVMETNEIRGGGFPRHPPTLPGKVNLEHTELTLGLSMRRWRDFSR